MSSRLVCHDPDQVVGGMLLQPVVDGLGRRQRPLDERLGRLGLTEAPLDRGGRAGRPDALTRRHQSTPLEDRVESRACLHEVAPRPPVAPDARCQHELAAWILVAGRVVERGAQRVLLQVELAQLLGGQVVHQVRLVDEVHHPVHQPRLDAGTSLAQQLVAVLADRLEQADAPLAVNVDRIHEVVVDELDEDLIIRTRDDRCRLERAGWRGRPRARRATRSPAARGG